MKTIAVVGSWHNAFVTAACLSAHHSVTLVSEAPKLDIHEPSLEELLAKNEAEGRFRRIDLATFKKERSFFDYGWVAIDTPLDEEDRPLVEPVREACRWAAFVCRGAPKAPTRGGLVISSQVPLGFCQEVAREHAAMDLPVAYVPENLRLGNGLATFAGERTVIGASDPEYGSEVELLLTELRPGMPPKLPGAIRTNLQTAEMIKHATNAFLATSISLANELAMIASRHGIDAYAVGEAMKAEPRIGPRAYVTPGMGFAGGTLPRDLRALQEAALRGHPDRRTIPPHHAAPLITSVLGVNEGVYHEILDLLSGVYPVLLLGYSYKADVQTLRRSPAIELARVGWDTGLGFVGYDPPMNGHDLSELEPAGIEHWPAWPQKASRFDTVVVLTARPEFKGLDWSYLDARFVLDCCDGVSPDAVLAAGIPYKRLWGPLRYPAGARGGVVPVPRPGGNVRPSGDR
jgi:UDPglucose 6-dehydrogenase